MGRCFCLWCLLVACEPSLALAGKMDFWSRPRKGTNFFNKKPTRQRFLAARRLGIEFVRLAPNKWASTQRDFLLGDAGNYRSLVVADVQKLKKVLDLATSLQRKVVLTTLSLPGARWRQQARLPQTKKTTAEDLRPLSWPANNYPISHNWTVEKGSWTKQMKQG